MRALLALAVAIPCLLAPQVALAAPAALEGVYDVEGWNPGTASSAPADYHGSLSLAAQGNGWEADWVVGNDHTHGVALLHEVGGKRVLAIGYVDGGAPGIALYEVSPDGKVLNGVWGVGGGGREIDRRK